MASPFGAGVTVAEACAGMDRSTLLDFAAIVEDANRPDDFIAVARQLAQVAGSGMTGKERAVFAAAFKSRMGPARQAWRRLKEMAADEADARGADAEKRAEAVAAVRSGAESDMREVCTEVLALSDKLVAGCGDAPESTAFFLKLAGDYARYRAEFESGSIKEVMIERAQSRYQTAYDSACTTMPPTHPTRLGLALNFSVFHYEIANDTHSAATLAKSAFDAAFEGLDSLSESSFRDTTAIMQLLRDNLTMWKTNADN